MPVLLLLLFHVGQFALFANERMDYECFGVIIDRMQMLVNDL